MSARTIITFSWRFSGDARQHERYRVIVEPTEAHEGYRASGDVMLEPTVHVERLHRDQLDKDSWRPVEPLHREAVIVIAFARLGEMTAVHLEPWNNSTAKKTLPKGWRWDQDLGVLLIDAGMFEGRP